MAVAFGRAQVMQQARVHHVLDIVSGLYWGPCYALWEGQRYRYDNGSGDHFVMGWEEEGLVVLMFNHESSERSEWPVDVAERNPLQRLPGLPTELVALANDCADIGERLATAGLWLSGEDGRLSDPWDPDTRWYHGLEMLWGFEREPEAACFDERRGWASSFSVERSHAEVAIALATGSLAGNMSMTAEQGAVLMAPPEGGALEEERLADTREELVKLGIHWR